MTATTPTKRRRTPYARLPEDLEAHGFVADLYQQLRAAALGLPLTVLRKNGDYYIAVRVPDSSELAAIDAASAPMEAK